MQATIRCIVYTWYLVSVPECQDLFTPEDDESCQPWGASWWCSPGRPWQAGRHCCIFRKASFGICSNAEFISRPVCEQHLVTKLCHQQGRGDHHQLYVHGWGGERHQGDQTVLSKARLWVPVYLQGFYSSGLLDDESVRETIKELQAAGTDNLDPAELESLISKAFQIQRKHSYILDLFQIRSCTGQLLLGPTGWLMGSPLLLISKVLGLKKLRNGRSSQIFRNLSMCWFY